MFAANQGAKHVYGVCNSMPHTIVPNNVLRLSAAASLSKPVRSLLPTACLIVRVDVYHAHTNAGAEITLIQGKVEEIEVPFEKVDVIIRCVCHSAFE